MDKLPRDPVVVTAVLAKDPASLLIRLKSSNKDIERGRAIGRWRDKYPDHRNAAAVRRWMAQLGEYVDDLLLLAARTNRWRKRLRRSASVTIRSPSRTSP